MKLNTKYKYNSNQEFSSYIMAIMAKLGDYTNNLGTMHFKGDILWYLNYSSIVFLKEEKNKYKPDKHINIYQ